MCGGIFQFVVRGAGLAGVMCMLGACVTEPVSVEPPPAVETAVIPQDTEPQVEVAVVVPEPETELAAETPEVPPVAGSEYVRSDVEWIQGRLQELGYYSGEVDGAPGQGTRDAIRAYQRDQDLETDGRPTAQLREFMWRNGG